VPRPSLGFFFLALVPVRPVWRHDPLLDPSAYRRRRGPKSPATMRRIPVPSWIYCAQFEQMDGDHECTLNRKGTFCVLSRRPRKAVYLPCCPFYPVQQPAKPSDNSRPAAERVRNGYAGPRRVIAFGASAKSWKCFCVDRRTARPRRPGCTATTSGCWSAASGCRRSWSRGSSPTPWG
jgi:hypothetical protein